VLDLHLLCMLQSDVSGYRKITLQEADILDHARGLLRFSKDRHFPSDERTFTDRSRKVGCIF